MMRLWSRGGHSLQHQQHEGGAVGLEELGAVGLEELDEEDLRLELEMVYQHCR